MFHLHWKVNNRVSCNRKGLRERKSRKFWLKMHLHRQLTARLIFWYQNFHFLKTLNENLCRHTLYLNEQMVLMQRAFRHFYSSALVSCRGVWGNMKFNFVHNWPWQKAHFLAKKNTILSLRTFSRPPLSSNLPLLLNLMLCSYLQNGIYILLLLKKYGENCIHFNSPSIMRWRILYSSV